MPILRGLSVRLHQVRSHPAVTGDCPRSRKDVYPIGQAVRTVTQFAPRLLRSHTRGLTRSGFQRVLPAVTPTILSEAMSDMADSKIVTKKTAVRPAAATETKGAAAAPDKKVAAKKPAPAAATPAPAPSPAPAKPVMSKAAAAAAAAKAAASPPPAAASPPLAAAKAPAKKAPGRRSGAPSAEDGGVTLELLANVTAERRLEMIREAAYYKAEKRNFEGGSESDDWAAAEREIDELLEKARQIYGG